MKVMILHKDGTYEIINTEMTDEAMENVLGTQFVWDRYYDDHMLMCRFDDAFCIVGADESEYALYENKATKKLFNDSHSLYNDVLICNYKKKVNKNKSLSFTPIDITDESINYILSKVG